MFVYMNSTNIAHNIIRLMRRKFNLLGSSSVNFGPKTQPAMNVAALPNLRCRLKSYPFKLFSLFYDACCNCSFFLPLSIISSSLVLLYDESTMASSRIMNLASIIMTSTTRLDKSLESHNLPSPSFDTSTFTKLPPSEELQAAQTAILEAISELQALVLDP